MFSKKITVIHLSKDALKVALVSVSKVSKVLKSDETGWNQNSLVTTFEEVATQLKTNNIRLLLSDDFVKSKFFIVSQALDKANLEAVVTESESSAKARHENPLIGIALKKDSKAQKSNLISPTQTSNLLEKNSSVVSKKALIIFITTLILVALITGGILTSQKALESQSKSSLPSPPLVVVSPDPSPTSTPSASLKPDIQINPADYSVLVLNGTGGKGVAGAVKDILLEQGFKDIKADNAEIFDYSQTEVQLKKDPAIGIFATINTALSGSYEVIKSNILLTNDSDYDVIITVGKLKE